MSEHRAGFTLIELVTVLMLAGILAAFVVPKLSLSEFRQSGFVQQSSATIRLGQKLAIASGCNVQVVINSGGCTLTWQSCGVATGNNVVNPASGNINFCADSTAAGSPSANFTFDNIGRPSAAQSITLGTRTIVVESETGYTHES